MFVRIVSALFMVFAIALICIATCENSPAAIEGIVMVGLAGDPPDTLPGSSPPRNWCLWDSTHTVSPAFEYRELPDGYDRPEDDVDFLVSASLSGANEVSDIELKRIARMLDRNSGANLLGHDETDLELIVNYFCATASYSPTASPHFEFFPSCPASTVSVDNRDHIDFYLALADTDAQNGQCPSAFTSAEEDLPRSGTSYGEYHENSFHVLVGGLNASGDTTFWPIDAAVGAAHEMQHVQWNSDRSEFGMTPDHGNFNEFFASAAAMAAIPRGGGTISDDTPFAQSLIGLIQTTGSGGCDNKVNVLRVEPCVDEIWTDEQDCRTGYVNWAAWSAYLIHRFAESSYEDDLLYKWLRERRDSDGKYMRDMCGLASALDGEEYAGLGGDTLGYLGGYRLQKVFHDYSIAKWVDSDAYNTAYSFGSDISPALSLGLFTKNDTVHDQYATHNCYEIAVPPMFVLDGDNDSTWVYVPGNGSDSAAGCTDGWNDPRDVTYCDNEYCDPVKVRLWGSYYISFVADTTYYTASMDNSYLRVKLNWDEQAMSDSTELWVSLLKYSVADTNVYEIGDSLTQAATLQFAAGDSVVAEIRDFCRGGNEAVTLALSLVPTVFDTFPVVCSALDRVRFNCMPRLVLGDNTEARQDLSFRYSFAVLQDIDPGGSCPFLSVLAEDQYIADNNLLAGAVLGEDRTDLCVLSTVPSSGDGLCRLRISEAQSDLSYLDAVQLHVADVAPTQTVAMTTAGDPVAYDSPVVPVACTDEDGNDILGLVTQNDGEVATIPAGGWIAASFEPPGRAGGGVGTDGSPGHKIETPGSGFALPSLQGLIDITTLCYRENPCTRFLDVPADAIQEDGMITVRLWTPVDFHLDRLFFATHSPVSAHLSTCELRSASHSSDGDIGDLLSVVDGTYATLSKDESIDLAFLPTEQAPRTSRFYVVQGTGRYVHVDAPPALGGDAAYPSKVSIAAYPNPVSSQATLRFTVPHPGGLTGVKVYNLAGRVVSDLGSEELPPGTYEIAWSGKDDRGNAVAAGVYFVRVVAPQGTDVRKVVLVR